PVLLRDRFVADARLLRRELGESFEDRLSVPAPHLCHEPGLSLVMNRAVGEPATRVELSVVARECLRQFRPNERAVHSEEPRRRMAWAISLAGIPAARSTVPIVKTACLLRSGSLSPAGLVMTYWVQSRPSAPRIARSCVVFRWSLIVSSLASGSGITCCTSSSSRSPTRYGVSRTHRMSSPYKSVSHKTVVVISRSNPADTSTIRTSRLITVLSPPSSQSTSRALASSAASGSTAVR